MNNTIEHLSSGDFAVLPLPQAASGAMGHEQQASLHVLAGHDACCEIINEPTQKRS